MADSDIDPATVRATITRMKERSDKAKKAYKKEDWKKAARHWAGNDRELRALLKAFGFASDD